MILGLITELIQTVMYIMQVDCTRVTSRKQAKGDYDMVPYL